MSYKVKRALQTIAMCLAIVMLIQCVPWTTLSVHAESGIDSAITTETPNDGAQRGDIGTQTKEPTVLCEDVSRREESVKHFLMSDHTYRAEVYAEPVHYQKDGAWLEIDNTLSYEEATDTEDIGGYINAANRFQVKFANNSNSSKLIRLRQGNYEISFGYQPLNKFAKATAVVDDDTVTYAGADDNTTLSYRVTGSGIKENIVVAARRDTYTYQFELKTKGVTLTLCEDGSLAAVADDTGETVFTIPAPFMYDANGVYSDAVSYALTTEENGKSLLTVTADTAWINREETAFPVTIDPAIFPAQGTVSFESATISSATAHKNTNFTNDCELKAGYNTTHQEQNALVKFTLPQLGKGDMVVDAQLVLLVGDESFSSSLSAQQLNAHVIQAAWNKNTVTWNTRPVHNPIVSDYAFVKKDETENEPVFKRWDITKAVKEWYDGSATNYGILIRGATTGTTGFAEFHTEDCTHYADGSGRPQLILNYRNNKGIESYWGYTSVSAGTAGTAAVNDYSGNLVFTAPLFTSPGERMPIELAAVYNGYIANQAYAAGKNESAQTATARGWRLNIQHTLLPSSQYGLSSESQERYPYVYTDGDGTEHYFTYVEKEDGSKVLQDEDGLGLTLTDDNSGSEPYVISDDKDNKLHFNQQGNLVKAADAYGNRIYITYENAKTASAANNINDIKAGSRIAKIQDASDHVYTFHYVVQSDGKTNNYLAKITDEIGRAYILGHNGGRLTSITYPNGTVSRFTYNSDYSLATATDNSDYQIGFTYATSHSWQVSGITEYSAADTANARLTGQAVTFDRSQYNTTVVRTGGNDGIHDNDDDILTTYQFDNVGRTVSQQQHDAYLEEIGAGSATYTSDAGALKQRNRVSSAASVNKNTNNLLVGGNGESTTGWNANYSSVTGVFQAVAAENYTGLRSLVIQNKAVSAAGGTQSVLQDVTGLRPGEIYTFSAYVKVTSFALVYDTTYNGIYIGVTALNTTQSMSPKSVRLTEVTDTAINGGWRRLSVSIKLPSDCTSVRLYMHMRNGTGIAYFDSLQFEHADTPHAVNLLENGGFEKASAGLPVSWTPVNVTASTNSAGVVDGVTFADPQEGNYALRISGNATTDKGIKQIIPVQPNPNDTYIVSGWANAYAVNDTNHDGTTKCEIAIYVNYRKSDGTTRSEMKTPAAFNTTVSGWQYAIQPLVLKSSQNASDIPISITIAPRYNKQANYVCFDNIQLIKDVAQTYTYDDDGNLTTVSANAQQKSTMEYDGSDMTKSVDTAGYAYTYTYTDKHAVDTATSARGVLTSFTRNDAGQIKTTTITSVSGALSIKSTVAYTAATYESNGTTKDTRAGAHVAYVEDQNGNRTTYNYDLESGRLLSATDPKGTVTSYAYKSATNDQLASVTAAGVAVSYEYDGNRLNTLTYGSDTYSFTVDRFGNALSTKVGGKTLSTNSYKTNNGALQSVAYGNGWGKRYGYNRLGMTTRILAGPVGSETSRYSWQYDSSGVLRSQIDYITGTRYEYTYDSIGRLARTTRQDTTTDEQIGAVEYGYDLRNNLTRLTLNAGNRTFTQRYLYSAVSGNDGSADYAKDNLPTRYQLTADRYTDYVYDDLNRLTERKFTSTDPVVTKYFYHNAANNSNNTTTQLSQEIIGDASYRYAYDANGNITSVQRAHEDSVNPGSYYHTTYRNYTYDSLNQLTEEYIAAGAQTFQYDYDSYGNRTEKYIENGFEEGYTRVFYEYDSDSDAGWSNLLTEVSTCTYTDNGGLINSMSQTIDYDAIGNPVSYLGATMTWNGRELATYQKDGTSIAYTYGSDGLRSSKTVNGTKIEYVYVNGKVAYEKRGDKQLYLWYDSYGNLAALRYFQNANDDTGVLVYATTNAQGDVVGLYTGSGTQCVWYEYDAWGNLVDMTDLSGVGIGTINPIRYRGYYYDTETGLYYCNSRYYDSEIGRFINRDSVLSSVGRFQGNNPFVYCLNNPVNMVDKTGCWSTWNDFWADVTACVETVLDYANAAVNSLELELGFGAGGKVSDSIDEMELSGGMKADFVNLELTKDGWEATKKLDGGIVVTWGPFSLGPQSTQKFPLTHDCEGDVCTHYEDPEETWFSIDETIEIAGVDFYVLFGASFSFRFNYKTFVEELIKLDQ